MEARAFTHTIIYFTRCTSSAKLLPDYEQRRPKRLKADTPGLRAWIGWRVDSQGHRFVSSVLGGIVATMRVLRAQSRERKEQERGPSDIVDTPNHKVPWRETLFAIRRKTRKGTVRLFLNLCS